jgi:hypothetical protein
LFLFCSFLAYESIMLRRAAEPRRKRKVPAQGPALA